ncbi:hypothetical protein LIER_40543 [Lithospermum erythrorhizon]|uniref:Reverse transcriptase n=1 Tax=Lithospermum erythrorhizon TaxID=34254 RepID=A0AAV3QZA1_LITER
MKQLKGKLRELNDKSYSHISSRVIENQLEVKNIQSKSRISWAKDGDVSTKYFHTYMRIHQARNRISTIKDKYGHRVNDYEKVKTVTIDFYKTLFSKPCGFPEELTMKLQEAVTKSINYDDQQTLVRPVTDEEIEGVVFSLKKGKVPGPDGYPIEFYRDTWSITKQSVCV